MRILHVAPSLAPKHGGPTEAILGMVQALREEGVDARIVSTDDDVKDRLAVPLDQWTSHQGLPAYFVSRTASNQHTLAGFTLAPRLIPFLWREIPRYDFVHVHTVFSFPATVAMVIARLKKKPYAVRPLGQLAQWSLSVRNKIKRLHLAIIGRSNLNRAAFVHATSAKEAHEIDLLGLSVPTKVVAHGVTLPLLVEDAQIRLKRDLSIGEGCPIALYLARVHPQKGPEMLLQALSRASARSAQLIICGDGEPAYIKSLQVLAADLGIASRVHWLGFVHGERKWEIIQGCDFFVLPSYAENFGIAVVEALACGLFVIVSSEVGIAPDVSRPGIGRAAHRDISAIAGAIDECIATESFDVSARAARRGFVERRFSWKSTAAQLIAAYKNT